VQLLVANSIHPNKLVCFLLSKTKSIAHTAMRGCIFSGAKTAPSPKADSQIPAPRYIPARQLPDVHWEAYWYSAYFSARLVGFLLKGKTKKRKKPKTPRVKQVFIEPHCIYTQGSQ